MARRITADLDTKDKFLILKSVYNAISIKKVEEIILKPSHSKGWHLIIWTKHNYTQKEIYNLRKKLGDDLRRIKLDKLRIVGKQTLFDKKTFKKGKNLK